MSFIVSISGPAGAGKTSLCRKIQEQIPDAIYISFDDFRTRECFPADIEKWIREGISLQEIKSPLYTQALQQLKLGNAFCHPGINELIYDPGSVILTDEPFGRERLEIAPLLDLAVFLDIPLDVGLVRAVRRKTEFLSGQCNKHALSSDDLENLVTTIDAFLDMYMAVSRPLYCKINASVPLGCDATMDGTRPIDDLTEEAIKLIMERMQLCT